MVCAESTYIMHQSIGRAAQTASIKICKHCGASVPKNETSLFCCRGCFAVYSLLKERGLDEYYVLRDRGGGGFTNVKNEAPQHWSIQNLDDPSVVEKFSFNVTSWLIILLSMIEFRKSVCVFFSIPTL